MRQVEFMSIRLRAGDYGNMHGVDYRRTQIVFVFRYGLPVYELCTEPIAGADASNTWLHVAGFSKYCHVVQIPRSGLSTHVIK